MMYARDANSVNIYCHKVGDCNKGTIECPENSLNVTYIVMMTQPQILETLKCIQQMVIGTMLLYYVLGMIV